MKYPKPVQVGKSWMLEVDYGEARGEIPRGPCGYATEARSARTHRFILFEGKTAELFDGAGAGKKAPEYIRRKVGAMMRKLQKTAAMIGGAS